MGRPPAYDRTTVLDAAMETFWRQGYEATSMRDLVAACELSTRSMYDAFGDKSTFFDATLEHYHATVLAPVVELLTKARGIDALREFVDLLARDSRSWGCLYVNTAAEREAVDDAAVQRVDRYATTLRSLLRQKLREARTDGEFAGDIDARVTQFSMTLTGFLVSLRSGGDIEALADALRSVIDDIERD